MRIMWQICESRIYGNEVIGMKFKVIDNKTGKEADTYEIALHEEWAKGLVYCDMEGFAITENGDLMLADECGKSVYCDPERFKVVFEDERPHGEWIDEGFYADNVGHHVYRCTYCNEHIVEYPSELGSYCKYCGSDNRPERR